MKDDGHVPPPENSVIHDQQDLLTINMHDEGYIDDALPGFSVVPFYMDQENGVWVLYVKVAAGASVPTHFHTGVVHLFTTKGEWYYKEHPNDVQKAGSYLFEPGGSFHTLTTDTGAEFFNVVFGSNINFNPDGSFLNIMDAGWISKTLEEVCEKEGKPAPRYIKPGGAGYTR